MKKTTPKSLLAIFLLLIAPFLLSSCTKSTSQQTNRVKTDFPLPQKVETLMDLGNSQINFQTPLNLKDTLEFYKIELPRKGLKERPGLTIMSETTFSSVFDGATDGKSVVVQAVTIGDKTNVNIRYELVR